MTSAVAAAVMTAATSFNISIYPEYLRGGGSYGTPFDEAWDRRIGEALWATLRNPSRPISNVKTLTNYEAARPRRAERETSSAVVRRISFVKGEFMTDLRS